MKMKLLKTPRSLNRTAAEWDVGLSVARKWWVQKRYLKAQKIGNTVWVWDRYRPKPLKRGGLSLALHGMWRKE